MPNFMHGIYVCHKHFFLLETLIIFFQSDNNKSVLIFLKVNELCLI